MRTLHRLKPKIGKEIPFLVMISFLGTFLLSRLIVYYLPDVALKVRGTHVHHFAYGIFLLAILGYFTLTQQISPKIRLRLSLLYGVALGLALDEFAMWIELEDIYYDRTSFDALMIVTLLFLNIIYFDGFWKKWGTHLNQLVRRIFS